VGMASYLGDIAPQIKAVFNSRKALIKEKKKKKIFIFVAVGLVGVIFIISINSKNIIKEYDIRHEKLSLDKIELENQKLIIEEEKAKVEDEKAKVEEEKAKAIADAEIIAKNNLYLVEQNIKLQNSIKMAASAGVKPQNYGEAEEITSAVDYDNLEYVGEFEGTAYCPTVEECGNNLGYTASGKPIIAGVSVAVDTKYWKLGTKFYIEGLGYVVAMDTGSAVKGRERFDYAVFDKAYARQLGRRKWKVYLVKEE